MKAIDEMYEDVLSRTYLVGIVVGIGAGLVVLLIGMVLTVGAWLAAFLGVTVAVVTHLVMRRPFLVEATTSAGAWFGWWVVGWRRARAVRDQIDEALRAGADPSALQPAGSIAHPSD